MICTHDVTEIDVAAHADGACPLCLVSENSALRQRVRVLAEALTGIKNCGDEWGGAACGKKAAAALDALNEQASITKQEA